MFFVRNISNGKVFKVVCQIKKNEEEEEEEVLGLRMSSSLLSSNVGILFQGLFPSVDFLMLLNVPDNRNPPSSLPNAMTSFKKLLPFSFQPPEQLTDLNKWHKLTAFCSRNFRLEYETIDPNCNAILVIIAMQVCWRFSRIFSFFFHSFPSCSSCSSSFFFWWIRCVIKCA